MAAFENNTLTWEGSFEEHLVYAPKSHPSFVAWISSYEFGDGTIGLSFDERLQIPNPNFKNPKLEYYYCAGLPVSYCSVEAGSADQSAFRVYLRSRDGIHFEETGRCDRAEGSFCNLGFPGGRIVGLNVSRQNEERTGWCDHIDVRESLDGGNTWKPIRKLLEGCATYLWRTRRMKDGSWVIIASFFGTPWGPGKARSTRTSSLPNETGITKIQTFFLTTRDGIHFSAPHYILPGIGAHEYDVIETDSGDLLFVAGDVQGHPCGYQIVRRSCDGWINGTLFPIHAGAPADFSKNPQGGYVPETIVYDSRHDCLIGYRRNKCFSLSNDNGENWTKIVTDFPFRHLYQPQIMNLPDGRIALYGHCGGGDSAFGENEMTIRAIVLDPACAKDLPKPTALAMDRMLSQDKSHYLNAFRAKLTSGQTPWPVPGLNSASSPSGPPTVPWTPPPWQKHPTGLRPPPTKTVRLWSTPPCLTTRPIFTLHMLWMLFSMTLPQCAAASVQPTIFWPCPPIATVPSPWMPIWLAAVCICPPSFSKRSLRPLRSCKLPLATIPASTHPFFAPMPLTVL